MTATLKKSHSLFTTMGEKQDSPGSSADSINQEKRIEELTKELWDNFSKEIKDARRLRRDTLMSEEGEGGPTLRSRDRKAILGMWRTCSKTLCKQLNQRPQSNRCSFGTGLDRPPRKAEELPMGGVTKLKYGETQIFKLARTLVKRMDQSRCRKRWDMCIRRVFNILYLYRVMYVRSHELTQSYQTFMDLGDGPDIKIEKIKKKKDIDFDVTRFKVRRSMNVFNLTLLELLTLRTPPPERKEHDIQMLVYCFQCIDSFCNYPLVIQREIARYARYSYINGKRTILREGHVPLCFYIILSGQAVVTRLVEKDGKTMRRLVGLLSPGLAFGQENMNTDTEREFTVTSRGEMQLLFILRDKYEQIFMPEKFNNGIPEYLTYLTKHRFLRNWPVEKLYKNPTKCFLRFYRHNRLVVANSAECEYVFVVRSGVCHVVMAVDVPHTTKADLEKLVFEDLEISNRVGFIDDVPIGSKVIRHWQKPKRLSIMPRAPSESQIGKRRHPLPFSQRPYASFNSPFKHRIQYTPTGRIASSVHMEIPPGSEVCESGSAHSLEECPPTATKSLAATKSTNVVRKQTLAAWEAKKVAKKVSSQNCSADAFYVTDVLVDFDPTSPEESPTHSLAQISENKLLKKESDIKVKYAATEALKTSRLSFHRRRSYVGQTISEERDLSQSVSILESNLAARRREKKRFRIVKTDLEVEFKVPIFVPRPGLSDSDRVGRIMGQREVGHRSFDHSEDESDNASTNALSESAVLDHLPLGTNELTLSDTLTTNNGADTGKPQRPAYINTTRKPPTADNVNRGRLADDNVTYSETKPSRNHSHESEKAVTDDDMLIDAGRSPVFQDRQADKTNSDRDNESGRERVSPCRLSTNNNALQSPIYTTDAGVEENEDTVSGDFEHRHLCSLRKRHGDRRSHQNSRVHFASDSSSEDSSHAQTVSFDQERVVTMNQRRKTKTVNERSSVKQSVSRRTDACNVSGNYGDCKEEDKRKMQDCSIRHKPRREDDRANDDNSNALSRRDSDSQVNLMCQLQTATDDLEFANSSEFLSVARRLAPPSSDMLMGLFNTSYGADKSLDTRAQTATDRKPRSTKTSVVSKHLGRLRPISIDASSKAQEEKSRRISHRMETSSQQRKGNSQVGSQVHKRSSQQDHSLTEDAGSDDNTHIINPVELSLILESLGHDTTERELKSVDLASGKKRRSSSRPPASRSRRLAYRIPASCLPNCPKSSTPATPAARSPPPPKSTHVYVSLQELQEGDVFGLDQLHMSTCMSVKTQPVSLVSHGAEVIALNKQYLIQNANEDLKQYWHMNSQPYPNPEWVARQIRLKMAWRPYVDQIGQDFIEMLNRTKLHHGLYFQLGGETDPMADVGLKRDMR